jgi:hypothetical protein
VIAAGQPPRKVKRSVKMRQHSLLKSPICIVSSQSIAPRLPISTPSKTGHFSILFPVRKIFIRRE